MSELPSNAEEIFQNAPEAASGEAEADVESEESENSVEKENKELQQNIQLLQALVVAAETLSPDEIKKVLEAHK